jgi:hypothetical protein
MAQSDHNKRLPLNLQPFNDKNQNQIQKNIVKIYF